MFFKLIVPLALAAVVITFLAMPRHAVFAVPLNSGYTPKAPAAGPSSPLIDRDAPAQFETATFAMG